MFIDKVQNGGRIEVFKKQKGRVVKDDKERISQKLCFGG